MKTAAIYVILAATLLFGALNAFSPRASAQGGVPLWTNSYNGPANFGDEVAAIAVDSSGKVFVTGNSRKSDDYFSAGYATIAYSNLGVPLWTNRYDGPGNDDQAGAIATDNSGNVFVTGYSRGISGGSDYVTIKYSNAGVPLWTNCYDGPANGNDQATAIAVDSSGAVFVTGWAQSAIGMPLHYATVAYSNSGVPLWTNIYDGGVSEDRASAIAVDSSGNVFVTGGSWGGIGSQTDYATIKYSNSGVPLWTNRYNGPASMGDGARAIALDSNGNLFVTGGSSAANGPSDYATVKYSNDGVPLWTNRYNGPGNNGDDVAAVAVDSSGNVFVTGGSWGGIGSQTDWATIKYSNAGALLWTRRYNGPGNGDDYAYALAVDSSDNVFVTGYSSPGGAIIAYSSAGLPLWTNRYNAQLSRIAVDRSGNVFAIGSSAAGTTNSDYVTIKYSSSVPPSRLDFQLLNNQLVLNWTNAGFNLQTAPALTGTFTNLPGATSPYTNPITGPQQFFRLKGD